MQQRTILKLSVAVLATIPAIAHAQSDQPSEGRGYYDPNEIVVTTRKQAESLIDVPLAITAFDSRGIENAGIRDLNDVARLTPGLNFTSVIGEFMPTPIIRGVAQTDLFGSDPNVAIFIDGVFTGAREALNFAQADIERIEVVKGPQSALYGRNAFAGAINIISRRPGNDLSARAEATYGTHGRFGVMGSVSIPLAKDIWALKITASHSEYGGSHTNLSGGPRIGGYNYDTFQATTRLTPAPDIEIVGGIYYSKDDISPPAASALAPNCEMSAGINLGYCGTLPTLAKPELYSTPEAYGQKRDTFRSFLDAKLNIGDWQVSSLTGYNSVNLAALTDATRGVPATLRYRSKTGQIKTFDFLLLREEGKPQFRELSQEIRLTSPQEAPIRGGIGGYYFHGKQIRPNFDGVSTVPLPADFLMTFPIPGAWNSFFDGVIFDKTVTRDVENFATFGFLEGDITDTLTARAELRYSHERQHTTQPASSSSVAIDKVLNFNTWSPRFSVQYKPNHDLMVYASAARGVKSGGFDLNAATEQYNPEYNWTYEIGVKGTGLDNFISFDVSAYYIDWTAIQIPILDTSKAPPVAITRNLGDATSKGFEAQVNFYPTRELTAGVGVSYTDARYTNAKNAGYAKFPSFAPDGDVSGNRLQAAPLWQLTGTLDYRVPVSGSYNGFVRLDGSFRDKNYMDATNLTIIPSRITVNLRAGVDSDHLRVELFAENLFDNRRPTFAFRDVFFGNYMNNMSVIYPPRVSVSHPRGRELGIRTSVRF